MDLDSGGGGGSTGEEFINFYSSTSTTGSGLHERGTRGNESARTKNKKNSFFRFRSYPSSTSSSVVVGVHTLLLVFLFFSSLCNQVSSLKCYHCVERPKSTEKDLSCAYFDMSSKFHKECTHSSFCMKRTSQFQLHNGTYVTIHVHKCADQSHKTMVQDPSGDWRWAQLFKRDLYNEGCFPHNTASMLTTDSHHCFCSTDFCNASTKATGSSWLLMLFTFFFTIQFL